MTPRTQRITSNLSVGWSFDGNRVHIDPCLIRLYVYDRCHAPARLSKPSDSIARATCCGVSISSPLRSNKLAHACSISPRQAYPYLEPAQRLEQPVAVTEAKLAFTVTL